MILTDQNPWGFIWSGFAFSLKPQHQAEPSTPCTAEKRREMSGGLASCIYVLVRLTKHFQQVLGCSSYLYLDSFWIWVASNGSFLQRLQMTSSSLTHPPEGTCFRLTIPSSTAFLYTTHSATQILAILLQALPMGGYHQRSETHHLWRKQINIPALTARFLLGLIWSLWKWTSFL